MYDAVALATVCSAASCSRLKFPGAFSGMVVATAAAAAGGLLSCVAGTDCATRRTGLAALDTSLGGDCDLGTARPPADPRGVEDPRGVDDPRGPRGVEDPPRGVEDPPRGVDEPRGVEDPPRGVEDPRGPRRVDVPRCLGDPRGVEPPFDRLPCSDGKPRALKGLTTCSSGCFTSRGVANDRSRDEAVRCGGGFHSGSGASRR